MADGRSIDLVIKDMKSMEIFIKFLIWSLKTIDGKKKSAVQLLNHQNEEQFNRIMKFTKKNKVSKDKEL